MDFSTVLKKNSWILVLIFALVFMLLFGCSTPGSITIGGSYDGVSGNITYNWDGAKTKDAGLPVFTDDKGNSVAIVGENDLSQIWEKIQGYIGVKSSAKVEKPKMVELVQLLFKKKK